MLRKLKKPVSRETQQFSTHWVYWVETATRMLRAMSFKRLTTKTLKSTMKEISNGTTSKISFWNSLYQLNSLPNSQTMLPKQTFKGWSRNKGCKTWTSRTNTMKKNTMRKKNYSNSKMSCLKRRRKRKKRLLNRVRDKTRRRRNLTMTVTTMKSMMLKRDHHIFKNYFL